MDLCGPDDNAALRHWIYAIDGEILGHPELGDAYLAGRQSVALEVFTSRLEVFTSRQPDKGAITGYA